MVGDSEGVHATTGFFGAWKGIYFWKRVPGWVQTPETFLKPSPFARGQAENRAFWKWWRHSPNFIQSPFTLTEASGWAPPSKAFTTSSVAMNRETTSDWQMHHGCQPIYLYEEDKCKGKQSFHNTLLSCGRHWCIGFPRVNCDVNTVP